MTRFGDAAEDPLLAAEVRALEAVHRALATGEYFCTIVEPMQSEGGDRYATERFETLAEFEPPDPEGIEAGRECVCDHIKNEDGLVDMAVAEGLKSSSREDMVGCLANAVAEPGLPNKKDAVGALSRTTAKAARDTLDRIAKGEDPIGVSFDPNAAPVEFEAGNYIRD